jgi:hypothetical protein
MAPKVVAKKPTVGKKKDDTIVVPETSHIPDGRRIYIVGGFSKYATVADLKDISVEPPASGDTVRFIEGTYSHDGTPIEVRNLHLVAPESAATAAAAAAAAATAAAARATEEAEGGDVIGEADGDEEEDTTAGTSGPQQLPAQSMTVPAIATDVVLTGTYNFAAYVPPPPPPPPPPPAPEPVPDKGRASVMGMRGKKAAAVVEEAPPVEVAPPPPVEEEKGARPSTWPTLTVTGVTFQDAAVVLRGVHAHFERCHFIGGVAGGAAGHQVAVHQYARATFDGCTFSAPGRTGVYVFPTGSAHFDGCLFAGYNLLDAQEGRGGGAAALQRARTEATGRGTLNQAAVMADAAAVTLDGCRITDMAHGVILHDAASAAASTVRQCYFESIDGCAVYCDRSGAGAITQCVFGPCAGYALRFGKGSRPKVLRNQAQGRVLIEAGATPQLLNNTFRQRVDDRNGVSNAAMQVRY